MFLWDVEQENGTLRQKRRVCTSSDQEGHTFLGIHTYLARNWNGICYTFPRPALDRPAICSTAPTRARHPNTIRYTCAIRASNPHAICDTCPTTGFNRNAIRRTLTTLAPNPDAIRRTLAILAPNRDAICYTFVGSERRNDVFLWDSDQENDTFLDTPTKTSPGIMEFPEDRPSQRMN